MRYLFGGVLLFAFLAVVGCPPSVVTQQIDVYSTFYDQSLEPLGTIDGIRELHPVVVPEPNKTDKIGLGYSGRTSPPEYVSTTAKYKLNPDLGIPELVYSVNAQTFQYVEPPIIIGQQPPRKSAVEGAIIAALFAGGAIANVLEMANGFEVILPFGPAVDTLVVTSTFKVEGLERSHVTIFKNGGDDGNGNGGGNPVPVVTNPINGQEVCKGVSIPFSAEVSGGTAPYSFRWEVDGEVVTQSSFTWTFNSLGNQSVSLRVTDKNGKVGTTTRSFVVKDCGGSDPTDLCVEIVSPADGTEVTNENGGVFFLARVTGGTAPFTFGWVLTDHIEDDRQSFRLPLASGDWWASVLVTDSTGATAYAESNFVVKGDGGDPGGGDLICEITKPASDGLHFSCGVDYEFKATASGGATPYLLVQWFFPDGIYLYGYSVTHKFTFGGEGDVYFIVVDANNVRQQVKKHIIVDGPTKRAWQKTFTGLGMHPMPELNYDGYQKWLAAGCPPQN